MSKKPKYTKENIKKMRKGEIIPANQGKVWTRYDLTTLISKFNSGVDISKISVTLQRSESSVIQRASKLELFSGRPRNKKKI